MLLILQGQHDIHGFYSLELQKSATEIKALLKPIEIPRKLGPEQGLVIGSNGTLTLGTVGGFPHRAEPEYDLKDTAETTGNDNDNNEDNHGDDSASDTDSNMERRVALLVEFAVREVGWVPREIYRYMQNPY